RLRGSAFHGVVSTGASTPESCGFSNPETTPLSIPTNPATAPSSPPNGFLARPPIRSRAGGAIRGECLAPCRISQLGEAAPFNGHQSPLKQSAFGGYSPSNQYTKDKSHKEQHHWMDLQPIADNSQRIVRHFLFSTVAPGLCTQPDCASTIPSKSESD